MFDGSCTTASRTDNNTANHTRPCVEAPFGAFDGLFDVGGAIKAHGWAIDQNLRDGVEVLLYVDQRPVVKVMADRPRPDVAAAYPYYGGNHGFEATIDAQPGRHTVCVLARDQGSGHSKFLAFASIDVAGPRGAFDGVRVTGNTVEAYGWVLDPFAPDAAGATRLVLDGTEVFRLPTREPRPDVAAAVPGAFANSGFHYRFELPPGPHQICVDFMYASGRSARLGCKEVVIP